MSTIDVLGVSARDLQIEKLKADIALETNQALKEALLQALKKLEDN